MCPFDFPKGGVAPLVEIPVVFSTSLQETSSDDDLIGVIA